VLNGVIAIPIMAIMMMMAVRPDIMGQFTIKRRLQVLGWVTTALMLVTVIVMFAYW
jgi:Mn2+/Fe2+ NRAMP family transporter